MPVISVSKIYPLMQLTVKGNITILFHNTTFQDSSGLSHKKPKIVIISLYVGGKSGIFVVKSRFVVFYIVSQYIIFYIGSSSIYILAKTSFTNKN